MPQTILGIDIGSYSIKIAAIRRSFKSFDLTHFYERRVQYSEAVTPEESQGAALAAVIDENALTWDKAIVAMPGQSVTSRSLTLPFDSRRKIDQTILFELENHIPFDLADIVADYHVVSLKKGSSNTLVFYTPKGQLVKYLTFLGGANLDPYAVCVEGVELANLMNLGMVPPEGGYALVDIGHKKTTITIMNGKEIMHTRVVVAGGLAITEAIARNLHVPLEEAEKLKIELGVVGVPEGADDLTRKVASSISEVMDGLALAVRQTLFAIRSEKSEEVKGVYLSGGTSRLVGIDRLISDKLRLNVTFMDCLSFHFLKLEVPEAHSYVMPTAVALALRGVAPATLPDVNFRRGEFVFKGDVEALGAPFKRAAAVLICLAVLALGYFGIKYYSLSKKLDQLNKDSAQLVLNSIPDIGQKPVANTRAALQVIKGRKADLSDKVQKLEELLAQSAIDALADVSRFVPPREELMLEVDTFNLSKGVVKLSGKTISFEAVDKIKGSLEKSGKFKSVTTGNVRKGIKDEIKFDITLEM